MKPLLQEDPRTVKLVDDTGTTGETESAHKRPRAGHHEGDESQDEGWLETLLPSLHQLAGTSQGTAEV